MFDAREAKSLKPDEHLGIEGCPGLRLQCTTQGRSWTYRWKSPETGGMRQKKIGNWPAMSAPAAIAAWEKLREVRMGGTDPVTRVVRVETVEEVCDFYVSGHIAESRKVRGREAVSRMFKQMLGDVATIPANQLTRAQAFDVLHAQRKTPTQAQKLRSELGAAWEYAMDAGRLPQDTPNWWRQLMRGKLRSVGRLVAGRRVTTKRFLSADEMGKLVQWLPNFSEMVQDVLTLYLWTGTRGSEIVAMEAHEIQEEATGLWWTIPKVKTKNARHPQATDLRVPLIGRAAKIVQKRMVSAPASGYLFAAETEEGGTHTAQQAIGAAVNYVQPYCQTAKRHVRERLPVTHWAPHDLRRSTRTLLASMGCPPEVAEAVLGHLPKGIEGTYNRHTYDLERLAWLTRLDEKLEALVGAHSS